MKKMLPYFCAAFFLPIALSAQTLSERLQDFAHTQRPAAISIAILQNGQTTYHHFGHTSKRNQTSPDEHTLYEMGALSGVFTTTLMLRLTEHGLINPEREIAYYLPANLSPPQFHPQRCAEVVLPGNPSRRIMSCSNDLSRSSVCITSCDLANHISGLPNSGLGLYDWHPIGKSARLTGPAISLDNAGIVQQLANATFKAEPGTSYYFSNAGIALLGITLESATQLPYEPMLKQYVLRPLEMENTKVEISAEQQTRLAEGHDHRGRSASNWHFYSLAPAAGLKSTAADLAKFLNVYMGQGPGNWENTILEGQQARVEVVFPTLEYSTQAAYGWLVSYLPAPKARLAVWMNGGTAGYSAFAGFVKDEQTGVIILSAHADAAVTELGLELLQTLD